MTDHRMTEDQRSGSSFCHKASTDRERTRNVELTSSKDFKRDDLDKSRAATEVDRRTNDVAAAQNMDAGCRNIQSATTPLCDDVLVGIADGQRIEGAVAVEINGSRCIGFAEAIEEAGVVGKGAGRSPVGEISPRSAAVDVPGIIREEFVDAAGIHEGVDFA